MTPVVSEVVKWRKSVSEAVSDNLRRCQYPALPESGMAGYSAYTLGIKLLQTSEQGVLSGS
jgi:hypothetical protein